MNIRELRAAVVALGSVLVHCSPNPAPQEGTSETTAPQDGLGSLTVDAGMDPYSTWNLVNGKLASYRESCCNCQVRGDDLYCDHCDSGSGNFVESHISLRACAKIKQGISNKNGRLKCGDHVEPTREKENSPVRYPSDPRKCKVTDSIQVPAKPVSGDFAGILALDTCSGSLVRFETGRVKGPAMALTNGHCYEGGVLDPNQVLQDVPSERTFELLTPDGTEFLETLHATKVLYATMTGTDLALYQLEETYEDIETQFGIRPLVMASQRPVDTTPIQVISGYWRRKFECHIDGFVHQLREQDWVFKDSIRYSANCDQVYKGASGSPVLDAKSRRVLGINNTSNERGKRCTLDNPCEVDEKGRVTVRPGRRYGQQTFEVYGCLDENQHIDLARPGCALPKP